MTSVVTSPSGGGITIECLDVSMVFNVEGEQVHALEGVHISVSAGEQVAVLGPSGSGKSTLTTLLAGLRRPTAGQVLINGDDLTLMSERQLSRLRSREIGVMVQNPTRSLLPYGTAEDNVRFAQRATAKFRRGSLPDPSELLRQLGLAELIGKRAGRMSGGEQQRLAVAVGVAVGPRALLADEPTSQLDHRSRDGVVDLLLRVGQEFGTTTVVVTHDPEVAERLGRTVVMAEGTVQSGGVAAELEVEVRDDGSIVLPPAELRRFPPGTRLRVQRIGSGITVEPRRPA